MIRMWHFAAGTEKGIDVIVQSAEQLQIISSGENNAGGCR